MNFCKGNRKEYSIQITTKDPSRVYRNDLVKEGVEKNEHQESYWHLTWLLCCGTLSFTGLSGPKQRQGTSFNIVVLYLFLKDSVGHRSSRVWDKKRGDLCLQEIVTSSPIVRRTPYIGHHPTKVSGSRNRVHTVYFSFDEGGVLRKESEHLT